MGKIFDNLEDSDQVIVPNDKNNSFRSESTKTYIRLVPAQDVHFFYTRSHLSALQNYALLFSTNFQFIFIIKKCITQFSHRIVSCTIFFSKILHKYLLNSRTVL